MLVVLTLCYYVCAKENWWLGLILVLCLEICDNVCGGVVAVTSVLFCPI